MLEVCVDSIESALEAEIGQASRIELCSALTEGGLTPSAGFLKLLKTKTKCSIPIFCMLRHRRGNDFRYSEEEIQAILYDMEIFKSIGCDGFVFGALDENGEINDKQCQRIINEAGNLPVTFHRAFDFTDRNQMHDTCNKIRSIGFTRILTSGFESSAEKGISNIKDLIEQHKDIIIVPGGGINRNNLEKILSETGCVEFHASARVKKKSSEICSGIALGSGEQDSETLMVTDAPTVSELLYLAKNYLKLK